MSKRSIEKLSKTLIALVLTLTLFLTSPFLNIASALVKTCFVTAIGPNAPKDVVLPPGCSGGGTTGSCGSVVDFSQQIADNLSPSDSLNKEITSPCGKSTARSAWVDGTYWCAYNVVDSYNLAGIPGLSGASVVGIHTQMDSNPAYTVVDYRTNKQAALQQVKPGWAFLIERVFKTHVSGGQHTGIIKSITIDDRGNGTIVTLESNGGDVSSTWPVANWEVQHRDSRPLVGFGGAK